jgi:ADP-heptose:LPS heptosyltransferase
VRHPEARVLVIGAPGDQTRVERVAVAGGWAARMAALRDALALVSAADLLVSPDTSLVHAASAFGVATVGLFQHGVTEYVPWRVGGRNVFADGPSLDTLPERRVLDALDATLADLTARHEPGTHTR